MNSPEREWTISFTIMMPTTNRLVSMATRPRLSVRGVRGPIFGPPVRSGKQRDDEHDQCGSCDPRANRWDNRSGQSATTRLASRAEFAHHGRLLAPLISYYSGADMQ